MDLKNQPNDPVSLFSLVIFRLNGLLVQNGDRITKPLGQSSARWQILARVGVRPQTVAQMARNIGQSRQSVQRIADLLVAEKLAVYVPHPTDNRTRLVELTPKGQEILSAIYEQYGVWLQKAAARLDTEALIAVTQELENLVQALR